MVMDESGPIATEQLAPSFGRGQYTKPEREFAEPVLPDINKPNAKLKLEELNASNDHNHATSIDRDSRVAAGDLDDYSVKVDKANILVLPSDVTYLMKIGGDFPLYHHVTNRMKEVSDELLDLQNSMSGQLSILSVIFQLGILNYLAKKVQPVDWSLQDVDRKIMIKDGKFHFKADRKEKTTPPLITDSYNKATIEPLSTSFNYIMSLEISKQAVHVMNMIVELSKFMGEFTNLESKFCMKNAEEIGVTSLEMAASYQVLFEELVNELKKLMEAVEQKRDRTRNFQTLLEGLAYHPKPQERKTSLLAIEGSKQHTETRKDEDDLMPVKPQPSVSGKFAGDNVIHAGISSDERILHMDVHEFTALINEEIDQLAESNPTTEPHDVVQHALGNVLLNGAGDRANFEVLDALDGQDQSVAVYSDKSVVCRIDGAALKQLESDTEMHVSGAELFQRYTMNRVHNTRTTQSDGQSSDGSNNGHEVNNIKKVVCNRGKKNSKHRNRYKGRTWKHEGDQQTNDGQYQSTMSKGNRPTRRPHNKKYPKLSAKYKVRFKELHVVVDKTELPTSDSNSDNASDIVYLTDSCSVCSTTSD